MAPYKVAVVASPDEPAIEIIVPVASEDLTIASFVENALSRASKRSTSPLTTSETTELRLNSATGYHIDADDNLSDVLSASDILFILLKPSHKHATSKPGALAQKPLAATPNEGTFQIRVITPSAAVQHADVRQIPLLKGGQLFSGESTLREIKSAVCDHFGLHLDLTPSQPLHICNCKLAAQLLARGNWQKYTCDGHKNDHNNLGCYFSTEGNYNTCARCSLPLMSHESTTADDGTCKAHVLARQDLPCGHIIHSSCISSKLGHWSCPTSCQSALPDRLSSAPNKCVVVSGAHEVEILDVASASLPGIMSKLKLHFGEDFETIHSVHTKGGLEGYGGGYAVLPIVALCSIEKHNSETIAVDQPTVQPQRPSASLDLHTAESPINTLHLDQNVSQVGLLDLCVGGVLSLYALSRKGSPQKSVKKVGKNGTFTAAPHWEASAAQSDRGTSAFLSSLRMFAHLTESADFADFQQNEVLGIIHQLTRFPPTVRAMHIVVSGKSLRNNESAAIVQSFDALLQKMVPLKLIDNDSGRVLEGSRLLFGLIIAKMRKENTTTNKDDVVKAPPSFPYINGYQTADLRDFKLNEPVSCMPVQTTFGLIDQSLYLALENGGILGYTPADSAGSLALTPNTQVLRIARLSDGVAVEVTYYSSDVLAPALQKSPFELALKDLKRFSTDLKYVASLCEDTSMAVVRPRSLATATVPSLTLSREGHLAVNLGHAPCSHNMLIFQPLSGTEEELDAAVVEQLLEPIVQSRERDGTAVFDVFSSSYTRKSTVPSELLMFVVDSSTSMDKNSDFAELADLQNDPVSRPADTGDVVLDDHDASTVLYAETKDWLVSHESFADMVALVKTASSIASMPTVAKEIIKFLRKLTSRELSYWSKEQNRLQRWASQLYMRGRSTEPRIDKLRRQVSGLELFQKSLIDLLVFQAKEPDYRLQDFRWHFGEPVPSDESPATTGATIDITEDLITPEHFICPISQAVFEDPVHTSDMLGPFDRRAIERWFRVRKSSPLTGLPLNDTTLRHDQTLHDDVKRWTSGEDITAAASPAHKRTRSSNFNTSITIKFVTPTGSFTRQIPTTLTAAALHRVAYRGMRGLHARFQISHRGNLIAPSSDRISQLQLGQDSELVIHNADTNSAEDVEDMCLVKIYSGTQDHETCAYWVSRHTADTVASILFKHWRVHQHNWQHNVPDRQVWSGLHHLGDDKNVGTRNHTWDRLTDMFEEIQPTALIQNEPLIRDNSNIDAAMVDAWSDSDESDLPGVSSEYKHYRVLKVEMNTYISPENIEEQARRKLRMFTRMAVSKQVFNAFINRLVAYNFPTTVGLVTFGSRALLSQPMTDVIENFRSAVDRINPEGDTAMWDAVHLAADQLINHRKRDPNLKCRIICLSDGCDTNSTRRVEEVCQNLVRNGIVLDSVSIGNEDNLDLRTVSYLTGGYAFVPKKLEDAVGVCELEPVLSQHERPDIVRPIAPPLITAQGFRLATAHAEPTTFTRDDFPQRRAHPMLDDSFVKVAALQGRSQAAVPDESQGGIQSSIRTRRLLTEIRDISMNPHPSYDVYVSEANMGFWKVVIAGPAGSAYEDAAFVLYLDMPEEYPRMAPKGRFVTPIFHPNISRHGLICHSIFDRNWTADTTIRQVLDTVFGLMLVPEFSEPINTTVILAFYWDEIQFREEVRKHIQKFARESREELGAGILREI